MGGSKGGRWEGCPPHRPEETRCRDLSLEQTHWDSSDGGSLQVCLRRKM